MKFAALSRIGATALVALLVLPAKADSTSRSPAGSSPEKTSQIAATRKDKTVTIGARQANTTVTVSKGARLKLRLASNPTTGFRWQVGACDAAILQPAGKPEYEYPQAGLLGAGGTELFTFTAVSAGTTALALEYTRASGKSKADKSYEVNVRVKGP